MKLCHHMTIAVFEQDHIRSMCHGRAVRAIDLDALVHGRSAVVQRTSFFQVRLHIENQVLNLHDKGSVRHCLKITLTYR